MSLQPIDGRLICVDDVFTVPMLTAAHVFHFSQEPVPLFVQLTTAPGIRAILAPGLRNPATATWERVRFHLSCDKPLLLSELISK